MKTKKLTLAALALLVLIGSGLALLTRASLRGFPEKLPPSGSETTEAQFLDRSGRRLSVTYQNEWNVHDGLALHEVPELLKIAFITAEDKRFYEHGGADWVARLHAAAQNLWALRAVRGASTITEQVVRMIHPRPRTVWSRWIEGFEAAALEARFSKDEILEFYLNQVPYARQRRGVGQAAREYFDRDLGTLDPKETLALAVLVRSPSRLDLHRGTREIQAPLERLAARLGEAGILAEDDVQRVRTEPLRIVTTGVQVDAAHFVGFARREGRTTAAVERTTLDGTLQQRAQDILDRQIAVLEERGVSDGALLVVDHTTDEILAWVNAGGFDEKEGGQIDMVLAPRQPGSTLKPFVYALALEKGWTAATLIEDSPISEPMGNGLHRFRNYSRHYYGPLRLREALGNSLNVPAVKAVQFTGREGFYQRLRNLGIESLAEHPDFYGDGLALGNGELSLFELVTAYAVLARGGVYRPLEWRLEETRFGGERRVFSGEVSSLVSDILSDPEARALEFGRNSVLALPRPTAVKTGTSNDYRDAWTVGFSHRYTVGVWMGNLDRTPMREVTGSVGPALVLRSVFAELHRYEESKRLYVSRKLRRTSICRESGLLPQPACPTTSEWFRDGEAPESSCPLHGDKGGKLDPGVADLRLAQPTPGLHLAMDPRIPDHLERFELRVKKLPEGTRVDWFVDDEAVGSLWPLTRGRHVAKARVWLPGEDFPQWTDPVAFLVR